MSHKNGGSSPLAAQVHKAHAENVKRKREHSFNNAKKKHEKNRAENEKRRRENIGKCQDLNLEFGTRKLRPSKVLNRNK